MISSQSLERYEQIRVEFNKILDSETLNKYKLLLEAKKLAKLIYKQKYSLFRLSKDFNLPYTTCKRVLSLEKANDKTWDLIHTNKISSFKVAQVLSTKDTVYQDELIGMVIKNNLSTYDIKKIRIKDYKDISKTKSRLAIERGFSRRYEADIKLRSTIQRLDELLNIDPKHITLGNRKQIKDLLNNLSITIEGFIQKMDTIERGSK